MTKKCPHCLKELPIAIDSKWKWVCQECGHDNEEHPAWINCNNCGYSPKVSPCPYCGNDIDLENFLFNFIYHN